MIANRATFAKVYPPTTVSPIRRFWLCQLKGKGSAPIVPFFNIVQNAFDPTPYAILCQFYIKMPLRNPYLLLNMGLPPLSNANIYLPLQF